MAYILERSILIHAQPDKVYDELLDIGSHKEWGAMTELDLLYDGPVQVGSRWRSAGSTNNIEMHDECMVTDLDRPRHFGFQVKSQSGKNTSTVKHNYILEPVPEGTRLTWNRRFADVSQLQPGYRLMLSIPGMLPLIDRMMIVKHADQGLSNLRDRVEKTAREPESNAVP